MTPEIGKKYYIEVIVDRIHDLDELGEIVVFTSIASRSAENECRPEDLIEIPEKPEEPKRLICQQCFTPVPGGVHEDYCPNKKTREQCECYKYNMIEHKFFHQDHAKTCMYYEENIVTGVPVEPKQVRRYEYDWSTSTKVINKLSREGWEVYSATSSSQTNSPVYYIRRPLV